jgi:hypothetical protein
LFEYAVSETIAADMFSIGTEPVAIKPEYELVRGSQPSTSAMEITVPESSGTGSGSLHGTKRKHEEVDEDIDGTGGVASEPISKQRIERAVNL